MRITEERRLRKARVARQRPHCWSRFHRLSRLSEEREEVSIFRYVLDQAALQGRRSPEYEARHQRAVRTAHAYLRAAKLAPKPRLP